MKLSCQVAFMGGNFASQPLAFAHILDASDAQGKSLDLDHIEVLFRPYGPRLKQWLQPNDIKVLEDSIHPTLIGFLPASGGPLEATSRLEPLGTYPAIITRAEIT